MITTQELAKLAGVSQSTVSRSLQNSSRISTETRDRIQELARQQGYIIKKKADAPNNHLNNGAIAIIISADRMRSPLDLYLEYLLNEIIKQIQKQNYYSLVSYYDASNDTLKYIQSIIESDNNIKGVIIINNNYQAALEKYLSDLNLPHIYTQYFSRVMKKNLNIIDVDHFTGGIIATNHLLSLGHQRIATLTSVGNDFDERTAGYSTALKNYGLNANPNWVIAANINYNDAYQAMSANWKYLRDCTAFFGQTDIMSIAIINYLTDNGHQVPQHYSVIGFDGIQEGLYCRPELSTVLQPVEEIAQTSIDHLLHLITQKDTRSTHFFVQPQLYLRNSTSHVR